MLKRIIGCLLVALMLLSVLPFSVIADTSVTQSFNGIDIVRRTDYLVIYTPSFGDYTGTNTYGTEVVVEDGRVISVGGNNSYIPDNGFVVSGHGTMREWLNLNVTVGMKVSYSRYDYTVTFTTDSYTAAYAATIARENAIAARSEAIEGCYFYDENADSRMAAAESKYNTVSSLSQAQINALVEEYNTIAMLYREREVAQYRGVWLRPTQRSWAEVEAYVQQCSEAGINMISVETLYSGTLIYPPKSGSYFNQNPYFGGFDVLNAFVNVCHKYNIELHVWMPVFYSGSNDNNWSLSVASQRPDWQLVDQNGSNVGSDDATGLIFLNPANNEVQAFLLDTYKHILETYDVDGFQLDYIRYRDRTSATDFGYDAGTIQKFKQKYPQYSAYSITYDDDAAYWSSWVNFRCEQVGNFVQSMRSLVDEVAPNVILSADVGASLSSSYSLLYQDAGYWLTQGWLDIIHPMAYGEGYAPVMKDFLNYAGDSCAVVPGLGTYIDTLDAEAMLNQTKEMIDVGCQGVVYFESTAYFKKNCDELLKNTLYTAETTAPSYDNEDTVTVALERVKARIDKAKSENKLNESVWNDILWQVNMALEANKTNSSLAVDYIEGIETQLKRVTNDTLKNRIQAEANVALAAALRDSENPEDESDKTPIIPEAPKIETELQLIIDTINFKLIGEDSTLITNPDANSSKDYNLLYSYNMLLEPVEGKANAYKLVETKQGTGGTFNFSTPIKSGMIVVAFHTDGLGTGVERVNLAKTVKVGTELNLFGVDVTTKTFTSSMAMLYIGELDFEIGSGDVNADGVVDQYDYILVKRHYFETRVLSDDEKSRSDVNGDGIINQYDYILIRRHYFGTFVLG